jgi:hypothetical protein
VSALGTGSNLLHSEKKKEKSTRSCRNRNSIMSGRPNRVGGLSEVGKESHWKEREWEKHSHLRGK